MSRAALPPVFREMRPEDLPAVLGVRLATVENAVTLDELENDYGVTLDSMTRALRGSLRGWLCEDRGEVVGFAMGDSANGEVKVVAVLPACEGRGIGRTLLGRVCAWLFAAGHEEIWLLTPPAPPVTRAQGFYRRLGWRATGVMVGADEVLKLGPKVPGARPGPGAGGR